MCSETMLEFDSPGERLRQRIMLVPIVFMRDYTLSKSNVAILGMTIDL